MSKFWDLFAQSIILQGLMTLGFSGVALYLWATGQEVPDGLLQGLWAILGFWFGTKVTKSIEVAAQHRGR